MPQYQQEPQRELSEGLKADEFLARLQTLQAPASAIGRAERAILAATSKLEQAIAGAASAESPALMAAMANLTQDLTQDLPNLVASAESLATLARDLAQQATMDTSISSSSEQAAMNYGKEELLGLIERLPASEVMAAGRYLEFLISREEAPVDPK